MRSGWLDAVLHVETWIRSFRPVPLRYPAFGSLKRFCARHAGGAGSRSLDLGCGSEPRNPFAASASSGVDIRDDVQRDVRRSDLATDAIPFDDAAFDFVTAFDFFEHVPRVIYLPARRFPFVMLMNEIDRVLKPGGLLLSVTPAYPFGPAFRDPTHVNVITEETFPMYFGIEECWARMYGFTGGFELVRQGWRKKHLITVLRKPAARA